MPPISAMLPDDPKVSFAMAPYVTSLGGTYERRLVPEPNEAVSSDRLRSGRPV